MMLDPLKEWWSVIVGVIASLGWLMRLDGQVRLMSREIVRIWAVRAEDQRSQEKALERIEAAIDGLRTDLKDVLKTRG